MAEVIRFVYTDEFKKQWQSLKLTQKQLDDFETSIIDYHRNLPDNNNGKQFPGKIIQGTGGAYKYRYANPDSNQGKSSSYRTIYFVAQGCQLWFLAVYKKNQKASLSDQEKAELREFSNQLKRGNRND